MSERGNRSDYGSKVGEKVGKITSPSDGNRGLAGEEGKPIRFSIAMVKQLLIQQKDIPREVVENILGQRFPQELLQEIADRAIQLSQADTLQAA